MEKTANVTVVIPNYNGIKYIDNCLKSLIDGETVPEIIVVDNGSRDGSAEIVEKKYPMCRLVRFKENRGFCHAVNEGIRLAGTEYIILLNNDTIVDTKMVSRLVKSIRNKRKAFSVAAKVSTEDFRKNHWNRIKFQEL